MMSESEALLDMRVKEKRKAALRRHRTVVKACKRRHHYLADYCRLVAWGSPTDAALRPQDPLGAVQEGRPQSWWLPALPVSPPISP